MAANANQNDPQRPRVSMVGQVPQQWEYWVEEGCTPARLNQLGRDGWRLMGPPVCRTSLGTSGPFMYYFERPVQTPQR